MKKTVMIVFLSFLMLLPVFSEGKLTNKDVLNINGYKRQSLDLPSGQPALSVIDIKVFDNVSDRVDPLSPIGGKENNIPVDKYLQSLYKTQYNKPLSIATFMLSGAVGPTFTRCFTVNGTGFPDREIYGKQEKYTITIKAPKELRHVTLNASIPCKIEVEPLKIKFNENNVTVESVSKVNDGAKKIRTKKNQYVTVPEFTFLIQDNSSVQGSDVIFSKTILLENFSAYNSDGQTFKQPDGTYNEKSNGIGARMDKLSPRWEYEGRILFQFAPGFTQDQYDALPHGTYRATVTVKVTSVT